MKIYIFIILAAATSISLISCDSKQSDTRSASSSEVHRNDDGHDHRESDGDNHSEIENSGKGHEDEIIFTRQQAEAIGLEIYNVVPGSFAQVIRTSGQIQAAQGDEETIVATTNGVVSFPGQNIIEGATVGVGSTIVTISAKNLYEGDPVAKAKIAYETALKEYQRAEGLVKDKIISAKEFEQTRMKYENARTAYEAQAANVTVSGVKVTSPISGYVKNRLVSQGEYVTVGQPVATISRTGDCNCEPMFQKTISMNLKKSGEPTSWYPTITRFIGWKIFTGVYYPLAKPLLNLLSISRLLLNSIISVISFPVLM